MIELENRMVVDSQWPNEWKIAFKCKNCHVDILKHDADCLINADGDHFCCRDCVDEYYGIKEEEWEEENNEY